MSSFPLHCLHLPCLTLPTCFAGVEGGGWYDGVTSGGLEARVGMGGRWPNAFCAETRDFAALHMDVGMVSFSSAVRRTDGWDGHA